MITRWSPPVRELNRELVPESKPSGRDRSAELGLKVSDSDSVYDTVARSKCRSVVKRVDTIILLVNSIEESVRFYKEKIGLSLRFKSPGWAEFVIGDVHLALHRRDAGSAKGHISQAVVGVSVNLEVDDIEETLLRLAAHGIDSPGRIEEYDFGRYFFIVDPDGYVIGFRQYSKRRSSLPLS
jgi:predicted enzyme related to lactoylglutathione lyase